jgi:acetylornithine deacetylase
MTVLLDHLRVLVAGDTRNPPREIDGDHRIFDYLSSQLDGFEVERVDAGDGCVTLLAVRGQPKTLVNVHLDTVPANSQWQRDPFTLQVEGGRAYGLGACDIKGGAAALLTAAQQTTGPAALLFTTDEEYGHSVCVHDFLASGRPLLDDIELVVVSEPTRCQAVLAHRGFVRGEAKLIGVPGHSAEPRALEDNANHRLARWLTAAVEGAKAREDEGALGLLGLRFNCGVVEGGQADNVIADTARGVFSLRPPPGVDPGVAARELGSLAGAEATVLFEGPALPAADADHRAAEAEARARALGLDVAPPVDFWTEAALFSEAGFVTFVCGPGNIEQAHVADEWVALEELEAARAFFARLFTEEAP